MKLDLRKEETWQRPRLSKLCPSFWVISYSWNFSGQFRGQSTMTFNLDLGALFLIMSELDQTS